MHHPCLRACQQRLPCRSTEVRSEDFAAGSGAEPERSRRRGRESRKSSPAGKGGGVGHSVRRGNAAGRLAVMLLENWQLGFAGLGCASQGHFDQIGLRRLRFVVSVHFAGS